VKKILVALAGNPNVGKSTLFNALTGLHQYTANWPGKTVERKEGIVKYRGYELKLVDLPGTYSLTAFSLEEVLARRFIVDERPDVVIHVANATTLEKDLYLTLQLLELTDKVVLALNMIDVAENKGIKINSTKLSKILGIPVVKISAYRKTGLDKLLDVVIALAEGRIKTKPLQISYGPEIEALINKISSSLKGCDLHGYTPRWVAIKLLEGDQEILDILKNLPNGSDLLKLIAPSISAYTRREHAKYKSLYPGYPLGQKTQQSEPICMLIAAKRRIVINNIIKLTVSGVKAESISDTLDKYILHRVLGPITLFGIFVVAFAFVFTIGGFFSDYVSSGMDYIRELLDSYLTNRIPPLLHNFLINGILASLSTVLSFIPLIFVFFLVYSIMEDSGYLARGAVIMDRFMHTLGLHGKAFLSVIMAFGCNVPGIMATRALESERDRLIAILINPLIPCSARLGVMAFIISLFFPGPIAVVVMMFLILLSLSLVAVIGFLLNKLLRGERGRELIIELPEYRIPSPRNVLLLTWTRVRDFLERAGTIILLGSIFIWFLYTFPTGNFETSYGALLGRLLEPIARAMGLDWRAITSLIFGILAKEQVLAAMSIIYGSNLSAILRSSWSPLQAITFLAIFMIYEPCIATIAITKRESGSWSWTLFSLSYTIGLSILIGFLVYNIGSLL